MINIKEQLKQLPDEFAIEMEKQKEERWPDVYNFIVGYFNCEKDIDELENSFDMTMFMKMLYELGFYSGVNFAIDPDEAYRNKERE